MISKFTDQLQQVQLKQSSAWKAAWVLALYGVCFLPVGLFVPLIREDGAIEYLGFLCFVGAAVFFLLSFLRSRNFYFLVLSVVFFFGAGEEISWGQRLFDVEVPSFFADKNVQQEINLHNLAWFHRKTMEGESKSAWALFLNIDRLFSIFWLTFCFLIPLGSHLSVWFKQIISKLRFPLVPLPIGILLIANYAISKFFESTSGVGHAAVEIKESIIAFIFLWTAFYFWTYVKDSRVKSVPN